MSKIANSRRLETRELEFTGGARNTILSTAAAGALAQAVTPTPSFNTVIYTGNGTSQSIVTGLKSYDPNWVSGRAYSLLNEQDAYCIHNYYIYRLLADVTSATTPDADPTHWELVADGVSVPWFNNQVWIKSRSNATSNVVCDSLRGINKNLFTDATAVEWAGNLSSFNIDGFTLTGAGNENTNTYTYVAWQEQFDTMVSGTTNQGKRYITASNAQSGKGMSIYVGSGTAGHEIPHGLGTKLDFNVCKSRDVIQNWLTYDSPSGATVTKQLDSNIANTTSATTWDNTEPTESVFTLGASAEINVLNQNHVAYFSSNRDNHTVTKMYQGTSLSGNIVDLGLDMTQAGAKVMIKALGGTGGSWNIIDNVRGYNVVYADLSDTEVSQDVVDFTTTGVIIKSTTTSTNTAGVTYIIEATVPNYDKPNGGLNRPAGNIYSYAEGVDSATGDKDSIEVSTSVDFTLTAGAKNYLFADKGNTVFADVYPAGKGKSTVDRFVSRASTATYIDPFSGVLKYAGVDEPRFESDGLLVEGASTNKVIYSGQFDNASWTNTNGTVTPNNITAPDGTLTGDTFNITTPLGVTLNEQQISVGASILVTISCWYYGDGSTFNLTGYDLGGVATEHSLTITPPSGVWTRYSNCWTTVAGTTVVSFQPIRNVGGTITSIGLWGAQLEESPVATSYIPTTTTAVTRSADVVTPGDFYDVATGIYYKDGVTPSSRIPLGEVVVDGSGEIIPDTIVAYPKTNDLVDVDVHGDDKFYGGFDLGQGYVDELANRLSGVTYLNDGDCPIEVYAEGVYSTTSTFTFYINGVPMPAFVVQGTISARPITNFTVPVGATYKIVSGAGTFTKWFEYKRSN